MKQSLDDVRKAYNLGAEAYARQFVEELNHKPKDVELLKQFADRVGAGESVLDIGCGPGHTTAHLASLGLKPTGVDLSSEMIQFAQTRFPELNYEVGDFFTLSEHREPVAGILAFYCIVHLLPEQLFPVFSQMFQSLRAGGTLLLAFHIGTEPVFVDDFLETGAELEFSTFSVDDVESALKQSGFVDITVHARPAYEIEYPTERCYIFARRS